jgi:hypothetical protein
MQVLEQVEKNRTEDPISGGSGPVTQSERQARAAAAGLEEEKENIKRSDIEKV